MVPGNSTLPVPEDPVWDIKWIDAVSRELTMDDKLFYSAELSWKLCTVLVVNN